MARKAMARRRKAGVAPATEAEGKPLDDTAMRSLSKDELKRLSIDAWEPSLLRHMLEAQNKLRRR